MNTGLFGDFLERPVAAIVVKHVAFTDKAPRPTLHEDTFIFAILVAAKYREIIHADGGIPRYEQIDIPVAVIVAPGSACAEATTPKTGLFGYIFEFAAAQAAIEHIAAIACDEEVQLAVVIVIGDSYTHAPTQTSKARKSTRLN